MTTMRSQSTLLNSLFADGQGAGAIDPGDMRDLITSLRTRFGGIYISASAPTTISVSGTLYKAAGTTTATTLDGFDMPAVNRLRYTGTITRHMHIALSCSLTTTGNANLSVAITKNGTPLNGSTLTTYCVASQYSSTASHCDCTLDQNEYLEIYVTNETNTNAVTLAQGYLFALAMHV